VEEVFNTDKSTLEKARRYLQRF